ncbi:hypothetical protein SDC9_105274 [bioreactor metagenome]|uniref:Uncharacterized protein n=1 Tax=bioreactor metagenome TaxID=1076179 RepID=A0A645B5M7_9ZZZZ
MPFINVHNLIDFISLSIVIVVYFNWIVCIEERTQVGVLHRQHGEVANRNINISSGLESHYISWSFEEAVGMDIVHLGGSHCSIESHDSRNSPLCIDTCKHIVEIAYVDLLEHEDGEGIEVSQFKTFSVDNRFIDTK